MALNRNSQMADIYNNEEACRILEKHIPEMGRSRSGMTSALGMKVDRLFSIPVYNISEERRNAFYEELEAANLPD